MTQVLLAGGGRAAAAASAAGLHSSFQLALLCPSLLSSGALLERIAHLQETACGSLHISHL